MERASDRRTPVLDFLYHCSPAREKANKEQHDGNHQQHVNNRADRVNADKPKQPRDEQNSRNCKKHRFLHLLLKQTTRHIVFFSSKGRDSFFKHLGVHEKGTFHMLDSPAYAFDDHSTTVLAAGMRQSGVAYFVAESLPGLQFAVACKIRPVPR